MLDIVSRRCFTGRCISPDAVIIERCLQLEQIGMETLDGRIEGRIVQIAKQGRQIPTGKAFGRIGNGSGGGVAHPETIVDSQPGVGLHDRLRLAASTSLVSRNDVIVVASVSCIYGLGSPGAYREKVFTITVGQEIDRRGFLLALSDMQYQRAAVDFKRGTFRVSGDVIDLYPAYEQYAVRIELFGDEIESISLINPTSGELLAEDLRQAQKALGEITGAFSSDDLLGRIFSSFCIGK